LHWCVFFFWFFVNNTQHKRVCYVLSFFGPARTYSLVLLSFDVLYWPAVLANHVHILGHYSPCKWVHNRSGQSYVSVMASALSLLLETCSAVIAHTARAKIGAIYSAGRGFSWYVGYALLYQNWVLRLYYCGSGQF
jgi:drug/metabolite transporter superfamily protein YnfA